MHIFVNDYFLLKCIPTLQMNLDKKYIKYCMKVLKLIIFKSLERWCIMIIIIISSMNRSFVSVPEKLSIWQSHLFLLYILIFSLM